MNKEFSTYWEINGKKLRYDVYKSSDFSGLINIKQVYGIIIDDENRIAIVRNKSGFWVLPGGGVEGGETQIDTLVREVKEETNCVIDMKSIKPLFFQKAYRFLDNKWIFIEDEVRYVCKVLKKEEFVCDPDEGNIVEVKWIDIEDLTEFLQWGKTGELIKQMMNDK